jgi:peptide/nickel transport system substrate-binding protein
MREVPNESIIPAVISGEIHLGEATSSVDNLTMLRESPIASETLFVANTLRHITFNTQRPQLSDYRVRQALAYAFDTRAYIVADTGGSDLRAVGNSPFSPVSWAFPGVDALNNYEFDMDKAHALMDEAGWLMGDDGYRYKDGVRMAIEWTIYHEANWPTTITGMAAYTWKELGVDLTTRMMDFATVAAHTNDLPVGEKDFDIYNMGWSMAIDPDLSGGLWDARNDQAGSFFNSGFYNDRLMELIEKGATTMNQAERVKIYHEIAAITNDELPIWVLSNGTSLWGLSENVHNMQIGAFYSWVANVTQEGTWLE